MARFNKKSEAPKKTVNKAGGVAFRLKAEQKLVHAVLTTFLDDKFYESGNERLERIKGLVKECKPSFVANLAVIARKEFNLRSVFHVLIGELSCIHKGDSLVKDAVVESAIRADDVLEIAAYVGKPMTKQVKRGIRNAILKFDRYQLAKYKGEGKEISMVDLFNLTHPKVQHANPEQKKAWKDLMEGNLVSFDTWETEISNSKDDADRKKIWETLILEGKLGYMALIRNLNNFEKYNISLKAKDRAVRDLIDPIGISKSKQLPFRFFTAYENVADRSYKDAVSEAMDIAVSNTPELPGKTLIAIDISGSMQGETIKKAAIFAASLAKANKNADVMVFDTEAKMFPVSSRTPVVDIVKTLCDMPDGGTDTASVFDYCISHKIKYDRIVIISDNQSWAGHANTAYRSYRNQLDINPFVYAIDIAGYGTVDLSGGNVFHLTGWGDRLLDFIGQAEKGDSLVEYVRSYVIPTTENKPKRKTKGHVKHISSKKKQ